MSSTGWPWGYEYSPLSQLPIGCLLSSVRDELKYIFHPAEIYTVIFPNVAVVFIVVILYAILSFTLHQIALREKGITFSWGQQNQAVSAFVLFFVFSSLSHTHSVSLTVFLDVLPDCVCTLCRYEYNTLSWLCRTCQSNWFAWLMAGMGETVPCNKETAESHKDISSSVIFH